MSIILSIIIPNYNNAKYLSRCLNSILNYSGNDMEVIFVDDGSNDDSISVVQNINDSRVIVEKQKNQGVSVARNNGIKMACGDYIVFVDSDDYYEVNAVQKIMDYLTNEKKVCDLVLFQSYLIKNNKKIVFHGTKSYIPFIRNDKKEVLVGLFEHNMFNSPFDKIYKKSIIDKFQICFPIGIKMGEDRMFNINYIMHCNDVSFLKQIIYNYCYGSGEFTSSKLNCIDYKLNEIKVKNSILYQLFYKSQEIVDFTAMQRKRIPDGIDCQMLITISDLTWRMPIDIFRLNREKLQYDDEIMASLKISSFKLRQAKPFIKGFLFKCRFYFNI